VEAAVVDGAVLGQAGVAPGGEEPFTQVIVGWGVGRPAAPFDVEADEGGSGLLLLAAVLVEPVGVDESRGVVARLGDDAGEEGLFLRGGGSHRSSPIRGSYHSCYEARRRTMAPRLI
jgi:hypothetical protein